MAKRTDHVSPETRSAIMRAVKSRGGRSTEKRLRAALVARGLRGWRMQAVELPGKPDFVFPAQSLAIFVDGCFWHGCPKCYRRPHSRQDYWDAKIKQNPKRDARNRARLRKLGWHVMRIWEHAIASTLDGVFVRIERMLSGAGFQPR